MAYPLWNPNVYFPPQSKPAEEFHLVNLTNKINLARTGSGHHPLSVDEVRTQLFGGYLPTSLFS